MSGLSEVDLVLYQISLVARAFTIGLREITSIVFYTITLISFAIENVFTRALLQVKILINVLSTGFARVLAWECCDATSCIYDECLPLILTSYVHIHIKVLQIGTVPIQGARLKMSMKQDTVSCTRVSTRYWFLQIGLSKFESE